VTADEVCVIDEDGVVVLANRAALERYGVSGCDAIGADIRVLLPTAIADAFRSKVCKVFQTGIASEFTENRDGLHLRHTLLPLKEGRRVMQVTAICRDMSTERKLKELSEKLRERLLVQTAELEEAVKEHEFLSYSVSHDLRAPLRHINCYAALLQETLGPEIPSEAAHCVARMQAATQRMGALIDHFLRLSRIGRAKVTRQRVNLTEVAGTITLALQEKYEGREVEVVIQEGVAATCDHLLVRQLLEHVLDNAWKFTSERSAACIEFGREKGGTEEVFFVRDNGVGFAMEYSKKLFKSFERLHGGDFEGSGVGLATAQKIVARHGGRIWAEGKPGEGAVFYFTLSPD